jgi:hypothetical protein
MNKHVEDTRHYLKRAAETAKCGVAEELEPVREHVEEITGKEGAISTRSGRGSRS